MTGMAIGGSGGAARLARELHDVATGTTRAARLAQGDYINPPSLLELRRADKAAGRAIDRIEALMPQIETDGIGGGAAIAREAVEQLGIGRELLRAGVAVEDDVLRSGGTVVDQVSTGSASAYFDQASFSVRGLADGAAFRAASGDDLAAAFGLGS